MPAVMRTFPLLPRPKASSFETEPFHEIDKYVVAVAAPLAADVRQGDVDLVAAVPRIALWHVRFSLLAVLALEAA